jgi:hypothetical protein
MDGGTEKCIILAGECTRTRGDKIKMRLSKIESEHVNYLNTGTSERFW